MKKVIHKIVCDVCRLGFEVNPEDTNLLFKLDFKNTSGYSYNDDLTVELNDRLVEMDICSVECLFKYAKKYHDIELEKKANYERLQNKSIFGDITNLPAIGDGVLSLGERLLKDGSLPPPADVINDMILDETVHDAKPETITSNVGSEYIGDHGKPIDGEMITLSVSYFMIVNIDTNGDILLGNSTKPVPLNTCIQFDSKMVVFPTVDDAVYYRDVKMVKRKNTKIVEVICDPVDYHSHDGKVEFCLFPAK